MDSRSPTPEDAFLAEIRARPDDDAARLIYADWLEDQGDFRAAYLRAVVAAGQIPFDQKRHDAARRQLARTARRISPVWRETVSPRLDVLLEWCDAGDAATMSVLQTLTACGMTQVTALAALHAAILWTALPREEVEGLLVEFSVLDLRSSDGVTWLFGVQRPTLHIKLRPSRAVLPVWARTEPSTPAITDEFLVDPLRQFEVLLLRVSLERLALVFQFLRNTILLGARTGTELLSWLPITLAEHATGVEASQWAGRCAAIAGDPVWIGDELHFGLRERCVLLIRPLE